MFRKLLFDGIFALTGLALISTAWAAESHLAYYNPIAAACTKRPLTRDEKSWFAHFESLRSALPATPAGWGAKDYSWTPPDHECVQKDAADYVLAVDMNYVRPLGAAEKKALAEPTAGKSDGSSKLAELKKQEKPLHDKVIELVKEYAPLNAKAVQEYVKVITLASKMGSDPKMQKAYDAELAKYKPMKDAKDKRDAELGALQERIADIDRQIDLLNNQERTAASSQRFDVREDHSARVYIQLNVNEKNKIRLMNTPLHPEAMNNPFVLCANPKKMTVPGALYAYRCHNEDRYNSVGDLDLRRGDAIVAVFARSKTDAPVLDRQDDEYYDRHFKDVQAPNSLLYIQPGKVSPQGLLAIQNVLVLIESDNAARVDELYKGMNFASIAALFH